METPSLVIQIKNLSKTFKHHKFRKDSLRQLFSNFFIQGEINEFKALSDINLDIYSGDFIGIIGRNGSGKSTLLKIIAGVYAPDRTSKLMVKGKIIPFLELGVGFNHELTGRENIYLNGTILGMTEKFLNEKFDEIVEFAEIKDFIDEPVKYYSSGMVVKLAFSIAIRAEADIYILDEILAVGDQLFQKKSRKVIDKFVEEGKTVIYVSHDMGSIRQYCNKVIWMNTGQISYYGETSIGVDAYEKMLGV